MAKKNVLQYITDHSALFNTFIAQQWENNHTSTHLQILNGGQTPPSTSTYSLTASATSVDEGASVTFNLSTTNVAAGTVVPYTISGPGITAADVVGGVLTGDATVGADGKASVTVALANDLTTEGAETLTLRVNPVGAAAATASVVVNDTSPAPVGGITLAAGASATVPATPAADVFSFDVAVALASTPDTQYTITGFDVAADSLRIDTTTALGNVTLAALNGVDGIFVQSNVITGDTLINFGNDADGNVVSITLAGVTDLASVDVSVI